MIGRNNRSSKLIISILILGVILCLWLTIGDRLSGVQGAYQYRPPKNTTRFAIIGDFGKHGRNSNRVSKLVKDWNPEFIITTGDNNYGDGEASTIDRNIGKIYHKYIYPYKGSYGKGSDINRFFPTLGNHDIKTEGGRPYFDYFSLPGNERYYDFTWGPIHFFTFDSNLVSNEDFEETEQGIWLKYSLKLSKKKWKIVYMHHPPYTSGRHQPRTDLRWPFKEWGATAVVSGHNHNYERIILDNFPYFVNGLGGKNIYPFPIIGSTHGSEIRYDKRHGAMIVDATDKCIQFKFININGVIIDSYETCDDSQERHIASARN